MNRHQKDAEAMAKKVAAQRDGYISQAITDAIGHEGWTLELLGKRLTSFKTPDGETETWYLDGKAIIQLGLPQFEMVREGKKCTAMVTIPFKNLVKPAGLN